MTRLGILLVTAGFLAGCALASPDGRSSDESPGPNPSADASRAADCEPTSLLTPAGNRVDLTGTWQGAVGTQYIRQEGRCIWWVALSENPNEPPGSSVMVVFRGELASDFTVTGEWMSVYRPAFITDPRRGAVTFEMEIQSGSSGETITLRSTQPASEQGGVGPYQGGVTLTYEGPLPAAPGP